MPNVIEIENLTIKNQAQKDLLHEVSLSVPKGSSVGIVGESGSGKSLMMKFLLGLFPSNLEAQYNKLSLMEQNPYLISKKARRRLIGKSIGYIPQNTVEYLHPLLKIKHQIVDSFTSHQLGSKREAYQHALELLANVEIINPEEVMEALPQELSGGMRQRVNIAMAMMNTPEIIIADEPTTALDVEIQYQVMQLLDKMHQTYNNSMILISHDLGLIKEYCDYVVVIYNGVIQEVGTKEQIFENPQANYTKALLAVRLRLDQDPNKLLKDISYYMGEEVIL